MSTNLIQLDQEQIVPLTLAWAGHERRRIEAGAAGPYPSRLAGALYLISNTI